MIPEHLTVEIVTPTSQIFESEVDYLRAPAMDGLFGVMPGHVPAIIALDTGEVAVEQAGERKYLATSGGYVEIHSSRVVLIVETAERVEDIDVNRAKSAEKRARERLEHKRDDSIDHTRAQAALQRALNRIRIASER